jgi:LPS O-antigen subunit length determinant protein (WzzB/FepE family)
MTNVTDQEFNKNYSDEINLNELFYVLWDKKFYIGSVTFLFALASILYSLTLPNIYKSQAIMMPLEANSGMGGMLGQYSGIAGLAGISLPSESASKSKEAIARIKSFEFFSNHFLPQIQLEDLMAVKKWNKDSNTVVYEKKIFDSGSGKWKRKVKPPRSIIPSSQEAYKIYKDIIQISEDKDTLFISLSVMHESPFIAQKWVELIIDQIDDVMRDKDKGEAMRSVKYLNSIAPTVNYEEIKKALSSLQQEQMKRLMMIEANDDYIYTVLDSPIVPEIKAQPSRSTIVILCSMLGMIFSVLSVLVFSFFKKS